MEPVALRTEFREVEVRVPGDQRIEGPAHQQQPLVEGHRPLRELQRVPDPGVPASRQRRQHVGVHVQTVLGIDAGPAQHVPHHVLTVEGAPGHVPALGERSEHLARHELVLAPRLPHDVDDPVRVIERRSSPRSVTPAEAAAMLRSFPRIARHVRSLASPTDADSPRDAERTRGRSRGFSDARTGRNVGG